ncbi:MAG TPA: helix-turn-helix domain-containing protein [Opitutaceae bacterium]
MDTLKKIATYKSRIAALEGKLFGELRKLPGKYGFSNAEDFIDAVKQAGGSSPKAAKAAKTGKRRRKRKPRAVITDATRAKVKSMVGAKKTSAAIAAELNISVPSVQNIKKALGLVKARR